MVQNTSDIIYSVNNFFQIEIRLKYVCYADVKYLYIYTVYISCKFVTVWQTVIQLPNLSHCQCCFKRVLWKYLWPSWISLPN